MPTETPNITTIGPETNETNTDMSSSITITGSSLMTSTIDTDMSSVPTETPSITTKGPEITESTTAPTKMPFL